MAATKKTLKSIDDERREQFLARKYFVLKRVERDLRELIATDDPYVIDSFEAALAAAHMAIMKVRGKPPGKAAPTQPPNPTPPAEAPSDRA